MSRRTDKRAMLLGLGLDNQDGHARVTRAEDYVLMGGSQETHEAMQEKAAHFMEAVERRGKRLEDVTRDDLRRIADEVGLSEES